LLTAARALGLISSFSCRGIQKDGWLCSGEHGTFATFLGASAQVHAVSKYTQLSRIHCSRSHPLVKQNNGCTLGSLCSSRRVSAIACAANSAVNHTAMPKRLYYTVCWQQLGGAHQFLLPLGHTTLGQLLPLCLEGHLKLVQINS
jgi:hypothetical protein